MKKILVAILCFSMALTTFYGCGSTSQVTQAEVQKETPQETEAEEALETAAAETAAAKEIVAAASPEATETEKPETIEAPIEINTDIPIEKGARIAVVAKSTGGGYWKALKKYMQEAVDYLNQEYALEGEDKVTMTFEGPGEETDVTTQINTIDAVLAENPAVVCLAAIDVNSCQVQLETAQENGIPVIMFDSSVENDELVTAYCGTDNVRAGRTAADKLCKAIGGSGEVAVIAHENITQTSKDRVRGFRRRIKNKHQDIKINSVNYDNSEESMEDMIHTLLDNNPGITGLFCTNGTEAEKVLAVLKDYPDRDIQLVGFDSGSVQKKAIADGIEYGAIVQDIYRMAYETIWAAAQTTVDQDEVNVEREILIPHVWVNQDNLESEENTKNLYE